MPYSPFSAVKTAPPDPILGLAEQFTHDAHPGKINLTKGVYNDETGINPVLQSVKQAERRWQEEEKTKDYLAIAGDARFGELVRELMFGAGSPLVQDGRAVTVHTPGGTGALRVGADFLRGQFPQAGAWLSDPTWPSHTGIFTKAGFAVNTYPYLDPASHGLAFEAMLAALEKVPDGDVVLLHACCHNPTGIDPTPEQWQRLAELFGRRPLVPFFDFAYQGFGDGLEEDAVGLRAFLDAGIPLVVSSSFSKNFGLYRERVGGLTVVTASPEEGASVFSQLKVTARILYSNPPAHGGKVVELVLTDPELRRLWLEELAAMRGRIKEMRELFVKEARAAGVKRNFDFLLAQKGMFSYSGIPRDQVLRMRERHGIYLLESGRINVAGLTRENIPHFCKAIAETEQG